MTALEHIWGWEFRGETASVGKQENQKIWVYKIGL